MICGPFIPNTLTSTRDLIVQEAGRVEHGLRVLAEDLVFGHQGEVDALACDASGAPVLMFAAAPEASQGLAARILAAHNWLHDNIAWLAQEVGDSGLRAELPPRVFVIGLEVLADTVTELRGLGIPGLTILQFCTFSVSGNRRLGVTALHDPRHDAREIAAASTGTDPFRVPNGIVDPNTRSTAARFLDLLRKVDPRMTSTGDRFSRRLFLAGCLIAELTMTEGRLYVSFPPVDDSGLEDEIELTQDSCLAIVDLVLRTVLFLEVGPYLGLGDPGPDAILDEPLPGEYVPQVRQAPLSAEALPASNRGREPSLDEALELESDVDPSVTVDPNSNRIDQIEPRQDLEDEDSFSLEPIRRSVVQAQLSREEFSALGED